MANTKDGQADIFFFLITYKDQLSSLGSIATIVGLIGLGIAWYTYRRNLDAMEEGRMNSLFRDFLRMEFDFLSNDFGKRHREKSAARKRMIAYKMWVLEEMFYWNSRRRDTFIWGVQARRQHRRSIAGWDATIIYHINSRYEQEAGIELGVSRECYSREFLEFINRWKGSQVKTFTDLMDDESSRKALERERQSWFDKH